MYINYIIRLHNKSDNDQKKINAWQIECAHFEMGSVLLLSSLEHFFGVESKMQLIFRTSQANLKHLTLKNRKKVEKRQSLYGF